jgi:hypothetical protein
MVDEEAVTLPAAPDEASVRTIDFDLPCRRCGYNLRGLTIPGQCPECQAQLALATIGNDLRFCDPTWVMRLARGMNWLCVAVVIGGGFLLLSALGVIVRRSPPLESRFVASVVVAALALIGVGMITAPDPVGDETPQARRARWVLRAWVVGSMILQISVDMPGVMPIAWRYGLLVMQFILGVAGVFVFFHHARQLALRIPDRKLADESQAVMWGVAVSYVILMVMAAAAMAPRSLPSPMDFVFGLSCTVLTGCVVFSIWSIALLLRYRAGLYAAARESRQTWIPTTK